MEMLAREFVFLLIPMAQLRLRYRFDNYPEDNAASLYGQPGPDPHGNLFPDFEYTSTAN